MDVLVERFGYRFVSIYTVDGPLMRLGAQRGYGERLREALRELFGLIHRRGQMTAGQFQRQLQAARDEVLEVGTTQVPPGQAARAMARRLGKHGSSYFTFVGSTPGVVTNRK